MKDFLRKLLIKYNVAATTNLKNDILFKKILQKSLRPDDNAIDIGAHKGEILELFLEYAIRGQHFAIEPIPYFNEKLKKKFLNVCVFNCAVSDENGSKEFYWIKDNPAYSGLSKRKFSENNSKIKPILINVRKLDNIIPNDVKISFIKIDVEGAELKVLRGAEKIIRRDTPKIAFEFGIGGSEFYQTSAADIFNFFEELNYCLYDFKGYLQGYRAYTLPEFENVYRKNILYNFIAVIKPVKESK